MTTVLRRIARLENATAAGKQQLLITIHSAGWGLALDSESCRQILRDTGFLPTGPTGLVNLCEVPDGLDREDTQKFLREHAAEICYPQPEDIRG